MSEIVKHETAFSIGQNKIANNDFFKELTELLEDDKFKNFYDKYESILVFNRKIIRIAYSRYENYLTFGEE